jgi:RNA 2',3'-cyclic 3'-phosphodiesterase
VRAENIHLTLAFLGETENLPILKRIGGKRHALPIEQAQYWKHNRIVWVGPQETPSALADLVSALNLLLRQGGFSTESRKFAAHVTLIRKARDAGPLPSLPAVDWPVDEMVLVQSVLGGQGPRYEVLERFRLS